MSEERGADGAGVDNDLDQSIADVAAELEAEARAR
jgi:hypothetical protein